MTIPHRGSTRVDTYFITASTFQKKSLFQNERLASAFIETILSHRDASKYLLHAFVVMPDHFHLLLTVTDVTLERAVQLVKGGFSFRAKRELGFGGEVWQTSFFDRRVRDAAEFAAFTRYIAHNPVRRGLVAHSDQYQFSSACGRFRLDAVPQRLKPPTFQTAHCRAKALLHQMCLGAGLCGSPVGCAPVGMTELSVARFCTAVPSST